MADTTTMDKGTDDNLMAAIAHAGIIIGGVLIALIVWVMQKEKSKYVAFQSMQALVYQLVVGVILFVLAISLVGILLMPLVFLAAVIYGLYGAYMCYQGKDFKYAVIGNMLAKR